MTNRTLPPYVQLRMMTAETLDPQCRELDSALRRRGVLVLTTFGVVWAMAGSTGPANPDTGRVLFAVVAALVALVGVGAVRWSGTASRQRRLIEDWPRRFNQILAAEAIGIAAAIGVCFAVGESRAIPAAVCLVVGAHFVPLAGIFDQPQYRFTGAMLMLVAVAGLLLPGGAALAVTGFGAALVLCATAGHVLIRG